MRHDPAPEPSPESQGPPFASWPLVYMLVAVMAVAVMAALWWFTAAYNIPMPAGR